MEESKHVFDEGLKIVNDLLEKSTLSRKERKEARIYQAEILRLVNKYFLSVSDTKSNQIEDHLFNVLNHTWKEYVRKWNKSPKRISRLRDGDFKEIIINKLKQL